MWKGKIKMFTVALVLIYVIASALGMVLIKKGGMDSNLTMGTKNLSISVSWILIVGVLCYFISFILWFYILQILPITYISPIAYGLTFIAITVFSYLILGANVTIYQVIGVVFIIGGIVIASMK